MAETAASYKRPESVLVLVYTDNGQVLLLQRRSPPDFWQSVTGSLEPAETPVQAAVREVREETGLTDITVIDCQRRNRFPIHPAWRHRYAPAIRENLEHVFRVALTAPCPIQMAQEHTDYRWLPRDEAIQRASSDTDRDALRDYVPASGAV